MVLYLLFYIAIGFFHIFSKYIPPFDGSILNLPQITPA